MQLVDPEEFFTQVWKQLTTAEEAAGDVLEKWFEIAGLTLRLRFVGEALEPYVATALRHLEIVGTRDAADLTLHCWDCTSLAVEFPKAPVSKDAFTPRGEVRDFNNNRFHVAFDTRGRQLSLFDARLRRAVYCVGEAAEIPRWELAEPIRAILSWFMRENGRQLLHGAGVGEPHGGVLLIGPSGAGKSNTALGCLASNLRYAGDDFCAVSVGANPKVYSLYCTGKTREADWARHPFLADLAPDLDPERREKAIYFLSRTCPEKLISEFPLKAILLLKRGGDRCEARLIPPVAVFRRAVPDTARLLPDAGSELVRCMAQLVRAVPCYELSLGNAPERIAGAISALLMDGAATSAPCAGAQRLG